MSVFNQTVFNDFVIENHIMSIVTKPIVLKSGISSQLYINWRQVTNSPVLLNKVVDFLLNFCAGIGLKPDCFFGVPEGATKLGIIASFKLASQEFNFSPGKGFIPMGRGKIKDHGDPNDKYYLGIPKDQQTIVVEDVTTTGGSLITCIDQLLQDGVSVIAAITLTNRMANAEGLRELFHKKYGSSCPFYALTSLSSLLARWGETINATMMKKQLLFHEFSELLSPMVGGV